MIRTREVPENWYSGVEKSKDKARKLLNKAIAIDQTTSVAVGKLTDVNIDKLWQANYPYCKLTLKNAFRMKEQISLSHKMDDTEVFFVNKPEMIMTIDELSKRFPKIYREVLGKVKTGVFD